MEGLDLGMCTDFIEKSDLCYLKDKSWPILQEISIIALQFACILHQ
jgi:hypothetical protein